MEDKELYDKIYKHYPSILKYRDYEELSGDFSFDKEYIIYKSNVSIKKEYELNNNLNVIERGIMVLFAGIQNKIENSEPKVFYKTYKTTGKPFISHEIKEDRIYLYLDL